MTKPVYRYSVSFGLSGCYMPDSVNGPYVGTTRRELVDLIRDQLEMYEMPASKRRDVNVRDLWRFIASRGSSSAHFSIYHKGNALSFHGLTEDEANEMERQNDY